MRWVRRLLAVAILLLILLFGLLFALQNPAEVPIDLLVLQLSPRPLATWLIIAFVLGGIAGLGAGSFALVRLQASRARLRRRLEKLEQRPLPSTRELAQPE